MPSTRPTTTIRFSEEDREILDELQTLTGQNSASAVIRLAIRDLLTKRRAAATKAGR